MNKFKAILILVILLGLTACKSNVVEHPALQEYINKSTCQMQDGDYFIDVIEARGNYKDTVYFPDMLFSMQRCAGDSIEENPIGTFMTAEGEEKTSYELVINKGYYSDFDIVNVTGFISVDDKVVTITVSKEDVSADTFNEAFDYGEKIIRVFYNYLKEDF